MRRRFRVAGRGARTSVDVEVIDRSGARRLGNEQGHRHPGDGQFCGNDPLIESCGHGCGNLSKERIEGDLAEVHDESGVIRHRKVPGVRLLVLHGVEDIEPRPSRNLCIVASEESHRRCASLVPVHEDGIGDDDAFLGIDLVRAGEGLRGLAGENQSEEQRREHGSLLRETMVACGWGSKDRIKRKSSGAVEI